MELVRACSQFLWTVYASDREEEAILENWTCWPRQQLPAFRQGHGAAAAASWPVPKRWELGLSQGKDARAQRWSSGGVAGWAPDRSRVAGLTICVKRQTFNFPIPHALVPGLDAPDPAL